MFRNKWCVNLYKNYFLSLRTQSISGMFDWIFHILESLLKPGRSWNRYVSEIEGIPIDVLF